MQMDTPERSMASAAREQRRASALESRDTRAQILSALERILADTPLHKVSVAQTLHEAGISRGGFYLHFESKYEAAGALLAEVMDDVYEAWRPFVEHAEEPDMAATLRTVLANAMAMWTSHPAVARTTHQYWFSVPELGHQWLAAIERFTTAIASAIDRARQTGMVPAGRGSRQIAAAGLWATEQLTFVANTGSSTDLRDLDSAVDAAMNVWLGLLFAPQLGGQQR
jgi:TetR/AcrR family transcriptional regulator, ethionamide resistance regulator